MNLTLITKTVLVLAAFVLVATVVAAIRQDSWDPIWTAGWLPAVLVGGLYRPRGRC